MDNLRSTIEVLYRNINPDEVIDKWLHQECDYSDKIPEQVFVGAYEPLKHMQNRDELNAIYQILEEDWGYAPETISLNKNKSNKSCFHILVTFTRKVLREVSDTPVCRNSELLRWREISYLISEDILTTAFFAYKDIEFLRERHYLSWSPIISTDNHALNDLLRKDVTDLHFHLYGSSLNFDIGWISIMNDIWNRRSDFENLYRLRYPIINTYSMKRSASSLYAQCVKACAIRQFLFLVLSKKIENKDEHEHWMKCKDILECTSDEELGMFIPYLQKVNERLRFCYGKRYGKDIIDYAIKKTLSEKDCNIESYHNSILHGERWIMYKMFHSIFTNDKSRSFYKPLFYAYLLIKIRIRSEFIQVNDYYGFANFQEYQDRKTLFIKKNSVYEKLLISWAIKNSIVNQNVRYLEVRIKPGDSVEKIKQDLHIIDSYAYSSWGFDSNKCCVLPNNKLYDFQNSFLYIFHFIKTPEDPKTHFGPRHSELRRKIKKQAIAINEVRQQYGKLKERVVGIDAASSEISCRPEVFAQAYRYLKKYSIELKYPFLDEASLVPLGYTYHVGEDFFDIADGLRAIDEAVLFLNLRSGDRLGHCLALGVSPEQYYKYKNYHVILSKQDLLDNFVWLLDKIKVYDISCSQSLMLELQQKYSELYSFIYDLPPIPENSESIYPFLLIPHEIYFLSWLLRGDDPQKYSDWRIEPQIGQALTPWDMCGINRFEIIEEQLELARKNIGVRWIYHNYHFNEDVRRRGREHIEYKISKDYVMLIREVQNKMMFSIAKKQLAIETNPTSNKLIGSIQRYDEHPLLRFFNLGLTYDHEEIAKCPQLSVSINTDDLGVFATSITNEYALIAAAVTKMKNDDGSSKYNTRMVYDWLERIREMGFEQRFKK